MMRTFFTTLFLLLSVVTFGQLFPKVADFHGNIVRVTERRYGKEMIPTKKDSGVFKPGKYSGWKFVYYFDQDSKLVKRVNTFQGKVYTEYSYQRTHSGDSYTEKEIIEKDEFNPASESVEYENFIDQNGRITSVNFWAIDRKGKSRELFMVEKNPEYNQGRLVAFTRHIVNEQGDLGSGERVELFYDQAGRLIRIERKDINSEFKTVLNYTLTPNGFLDHYSVDFLVGLPIYGRNPKQDIYYKCDKQGNWVRKYWLAGDKRLMEAKRKIKYR